MAWPDVLLPTTVMGSHALPGWFLYALEGVEAGRFGRLETQELFDDAVDMAIRDQEACGIDIVSDGEMRRHHFIMSFFGRLSGLRRLDPPRRLGRPFYDTEPLYEASEAVRAPQGMGIVEEFRYARGRTTKPLKIACPGPLTLSTPIKRGEAYRDREPLVLDLAGIINAELKALAAAGADFIQIDEPNFRVLYNDPGRLADLFNKVVEGVEVKIALHVCFGNLTARPRDRRSYAELFPALKRFRAHQFVFEFASRELAELEQWKRYGGDRELGFGVIDQKSFYVETPEEVAARIRRALRVCAPEKLVVNPDCGLYETPRWIALQKLRNMVEGARLVRRELGGRRARRAAAAPAGRRGASGGGGR
ncbi:MAG TPA: methionine synthase [Candidatus Methylomirabilis sp.]|jgi:5-methyltetrahydropteroyltriglutamate--homocysteine methyltransferase